MFALGPNERIYAALWLSPPRIRPVSPGVVSRSNYGLGVGGSRGGPVAPRCAPAGHLRQNGHTAGLQRTVERRGHKLLDRGPARPADPL